MLMVKFRFLLRRVELQDSNGPEVPSKEGDVGHEEM